MSALGDSRIPRRMRANDYISHNLRRSFRPIRTCGFAAVLLFTACLNSPNDAPSISEAQIQALTFELRLASHWRFLADRNDTLPKTIAPADTQSRRILETEQVDVFLMIGGLPRNIKMQVRTYMIRSSAGVPEPRRLQGTASMNTCCGNKGGDTFMQHQLVFLRSTATPYKQVLSVEIGGRERFRDSVQIL